MSARLSRPQLAPSSAPSRAASPAAPDHRPLQQERPVRPRHQPGQVQARRPASSRAWPPIGRPAGPVQRRQQRPLRRGDRGRLAVLDGGEQFAQLLVVGSRTVMPTMPWPAAGHHRLRVEHRRRLRPPARGGAARPAPAGSPPTSPSRHPRQPGLHVAADHGDTQRSGRAASRLRLPPDRGGADHARRPAGAPGVGRVRRAARPAPGSARPARPRASGCRRARCRRAAAVSRSFRLWTAKSTRRSSSASWISLENRPLPPISARRRSWTRSPVVRIACSSKAPASRSTGQKRVTIDRKCRVCQSASGEAAGADAERQRAAALVRRHGGSGRSGSACSGVSGRADRSAGRSWTADMRGS